MKYGVVIFPSKSLQDKVNGYRKRYDPHYALVAPHITLKSPFDADEQDISKIAEQLRRVASLHQPFSYHVSKVKSFEPVNNVIYFKVDPNDTLTSLYEMLHTEEFPGEEPYGFVPHITIGQKLSNDEHSDVYGALQMESIDLTEKADRFHLLYQLENGSWTVYETFLLGKDA
ncbi:YjcG family protein [Domibacillus sp. 8LH]|uniref:YjcG family protein n=1 Tax=unclassified Domibacillus TaxID=2632383 RepID=UPI001F593108|nr:YjcG family protein [Domibacillus sp. PGB-M46]MCI2253438.1 YjcG family protein [Domibacillus sp. PGB-M46]